MCKNKSQQKELIRLYLITKFITQKIVLKNPAGWKAQDSIKLRVKKIIIFFQWHMENKNSNQKS